MEIAAGQNLNLTLTLKVASASEEIMVTAERPHGEAEAINETRTADNLLQVLPAEVITSLPNANVADAIGRFPSVTLYRIEGEGVYIQVRGTEPRLTNATVDGITIPAPEPSVRQVRLDVIPSDMVDAVEMNKTLSANMDGNGIGGSVNLRTKEAGDRPTVNLYGNGGYTNIMNGRGSYAFGGTAGQRFGASKRFGLLGNAVFDYNGRGIDNIPASARSALNIRDAFLRQQHHPRVSLLPHALRLRRERGFSRQQQHRHLRSWILFGPEGLGRQVVLRAGQSAAISGTAANPVLPNPRPKSSAPKVLHLE